MTWAAEKAERAVDLILYYDIEGWGPYWHTGIPEPYHWCTESIAVERADPHYLPLLRDLPAVLHEEISYQDGATSIGSSSIFLLDGQTGNTLTEGIVTDLLAVETERYGRWQLTADLAAGFVGAVTLDTASGLAALQAALAASTQNVLWIGREAVVINAVNPAGPTVTIASRGAYGTVDELHRTRANYGDGEVRDHPHFVRDRRVIPRITARDAAGTLLPVSEDQRLPGGYLADWRLADATTYELSVRSTLARLEEEIGQKQFVGTLRFPKDEETRQAWVDAFRRGIALRVTVDVPEGPGIVETFDGGRAWSHLRVGSMIASAIASTWTADGRALRFYGFHDTTIDAKDGDPVHEVLLTDPIPASIPAWASSSAFYNAAGAAYTHPLDIALCLLTSSGTAWTNGAWDCLPETWGLGLRATGAPAADDINVAVWRELRADPAINSAMPNLVIGWDGKPISLKPWLEENILRPLACFLYTDGAGLLCVGRLRDVYPREVLPTITDSDIDLSRSEPTIVGNQQALVGWTIYKYGWDFQGNQHTDTYKARHAKAEERYRSHGSTQTIESRGLRGPAVPPAVVSHISLTERLFSVPLPVITLRTGLHQWDLALTNMVSLTCAALPDVFSGTRGITARTCAIIRRALNYWPTEFEFGLIQLPYTNSAYWAPSAEVDAADAGVGVLVTVTNDDFSPGAAIGEQPATDVEGFTAGAGGDYVALYDEFGVPKSANTPRVAAVNAGAGTMTLSDVFRDGGGVEVPRVAGDIVTYPRYQGGAAPAVAWTADMKDFVAFADETTHTLGGTADLPKQYGS